MKRCLWLLLITIPLLGCSRWAFKVPTAAMEPTIRAGDTVWADLKYYQDHPVERFDVIVFKAPQSGDPGGKDTKFVKRVIGLGGETIELKRGKVLINGQELNGQFGLVPSNEEFEPVTVPRGEYFVLGDNRVNSYDSRYWKPPTIKLIDIVGKVTDIKRN